ncbi:hypothetical protein AgCh_020127 [Apium graveolens]
MRAELRCPYANWAQVPIHGNSYEEDEGVVDDDDGGGEDVLMIMNAQYKGQSSNNNNWKPKAQYNLVSKGGYKNGSMDRSKIRCFNCDELGHFATECRKPKKVKKDKAYLELEAKYEALLKKYSGNAYITEGKSWDDTDDENENEEFGNYVLMALEQGESFSSKSEVPTLTTIYLNTSQYKETIEKMSVKMFHIHTSMVETIEEVSRLSKANEKLEIEKQDLELQLVQLENVKQENEYLKNKMKCASEIEVVMREKIEKNEVKLKSFMDASQLVGHYHEKNKPCANIDIGLDYDALNNNKKIESDRGKTITIEDVPVMLRKVESPVFKACEVNFSEEELIIKQELADEDKEMKNEETTPATERKKNPMVNQAPKIDTKKVKTENTGSKKKNRNGKIGVKKKNNFAFVIDAPGK